MDVFKLMKDWFNFCFENPERINPNHSALYFFCIEHCNRLGWKEKFSLPTEMAKEAIGIKNYRTYYGALNDLIEFGFITMITKSKNQYSANIIAIVKNTKAPTKAMDRASIKHLQKQSLSTVDIDILETKVPETIGDDVFLPKQKIKIPPDIEDVKRYCAERGKNINASVWYDFYEAKGWMIGKNKMRDWKAAVRTWEKDTLIKTPEKLRAYVNEATREIEYR